MSRLTPAELEQLKRDHPLPAVIGNAVALRPGSSRFGRAGFTGPCPLHSPNPQSTTSTKFECSDREWVCVDCGGGDVIAFVARLHGLDPQKDFLRAIDILTAGKGAREIPADERQALEAQAAERAQQQEAEHNIYRDRQRAAAYDAYYKYGILLRHPAAAPARNYLKLRGLDFPADVLLRFNPRARFYVPDKPEPRLIHQGPALLGKIQRGGVFAGVHMTFLDLAQPKGKALIVDPKDGSEQDAKKTRGSMRGGHVDLTGCKDPRELVLGEGIEKVLAVWTAYKAVGRDLARTAFWSAMNLGNLGGKHADQAPHPELKTPTGRVKRVPGVMPDMNAPAIEIPASVERLILLGDSTSDRFTTACVLARAAKRYARPGLSIVAAWSPAEKDFDDLLREAA